MGLFTPGKKPTLKREKYDLDADTFVYVRELSASELLHFQKTQGDNETTNLEFVSHLLAHCVVDEHGKSIFKDGDDVKANFNVGLSTLVDIQKRIMKISGLDTPKN